MSRHRRFRESFDWDEVERLDYKPAGTHFKDVSRRVLFEGPPGLASQLRYFEIDPGGHSTLERHQHVHAVMILRGRGQVLLGTDIHELAPFDLVDVSPGTWHQFRASEDAPLGFLCLVDCERDRPERPDASALAELRSTPEIAAFIRV